MDPNRSLCMATLQMPNPEPPTGFRVYVGFKGFGFRV